MKKMTLTIIIIWCIIGSAIIGLIVAGIVWGGASSNRVSGDSSGLLAEHSAALDGVDRIKIDMLSDECIIVPVDGDEISVKQYGRNLPEWRIVKLVPHGSSLTVSTAGNKVFGGINFDVHIFNFGDIFNFGNREYSRVEVFIPKTFSESLGIDLASGSVDIAGSFDLQDLTVDTMSGSVKSDSELKAEESKLSLASGKINLNGGLLSKNYSIDVMSGSVSVTNRITGSGEVEVASGKVVLSGVEIDDSLNIDVMSGSVEAKLSGDPGIIFSGEALSGSIDTYFDIRKSDGEYAGQTGSEPFKTIDAEIASGRVKITN